MKSVTDPRTRRIPDWDAPAGAITTDPGENALPRRTPVRDRALEVGTGVRSSSTRATPSWGAGRSSALEIALGAGSHELALVVLW